MGDANSGLHDDDLIGGAKEDYDVVDPAFVDEEDDDEDEGAGNEISFVGLGCWLLGMAVGMAFAIVCAGVAWSIVSEAFKVTFGDK